MPPSAQQPLFFALFKLRIRTEMEPLEFLEFIVKGARLLWAHATRLQQLHRLLPTTNVSNKSGNLLFAQK
jgi:hypothetical protein